jgi:hypothetical protein
MGRLSTGSLCFSNLLDRCPYQPKNSVLECWGARYIPERLCFGLPGTLAGQGGVEAPDRERRDGGKRQGGIGEIPG